MADDPAALRKTIEEIGARLSKAEDEFRHLQSELTATVQVLHENAIERRALELQLRNNEAVITAKVWNLAAQVIEGQEGMAGWKRRLAACFREFAKTAESKITNGVH